MWLNLESFKPQLWNGSDQVGWTASGLVATQTTTTYNSMRSTQHFPNKAKVYFELTANATGQLIGFGVCNASASLSTYVGGDANGVSYYQGGGWSYNGSAGIATNAPPSSGANAVMGCAWDGINQMIWVSISGVYNGSGTANPATNTLGFNAPLTGNLMVGITGNSNGGGGTLNAGATAFTNTIPIGFIPLNAAFNTN